MDRNPGRRASRLELRTRRAASDRSLPANQAWSSPVQRAAHWDHVRVTTSPAPRRTARQIRRWRQYLADERAESAGYRELGERRTGEEREILLALADAEKRHEAHWLDLLGDAAEPPPRSSLRTRLLVFLASHFGAVFVLALMQRAEGRSPYETDADASQTDGGRRADPRRGAARTGGARAGEQLSGTFRAAVFGANDGLVSNLALVLGIGATGVDARTILFTGIAGLLAGRCRWAPGSTSRCGRNASCCSPPGPTRESHSALPHLDVDANELALVYRARGMDPSEAEEHARTVLATLHLDADAPETAEVDPHEAVGSAWSAAISSFCFFASGALIPVLPYLFGATGGPR